MLIKYRDFQEDPRPITITALSLIIGDLIYLIIVYLNYSIEEYIHFTHIKAFTFCSATRRWTTARSDLYPSAFRIITFVRENTSVM